MSTPHVYRWDLDKTYLRTDFDSVPDLIKTALQRADEKQNVPGTAALMRELSYAPDGTRNHIHVVSGSPREMRRVLERKLRMDGATVDSIVLKPNLQNALRLRFRALRDQLGYKLPALLENRLRTPVESMETCFGDDAEMDGMIYRLYGDICGGSVRGADLDLVISAARLYPDQADRIRRAAGQLPERDPVERILIHLETGSPTGRFHALGPRVCATFNTFQASLVLFADGRLAPEGVHRVVEELMFAHTYTRERLARSLEDALRRGLVRLEAIAEALDRLDLDVVEVEPPPTREDGPVDYLELLEDVHRWHAQRKAARRPTVRGLRALLRGDDG